MINVNKAYMHNKTKDIIDVRCSKADGVISKRYKRNRCGKKS